jgi:hypothetical protein
MNAIQSVLLSNMPTFNRNKPDVLRLIMTDTHGSSKRVAYLASVEYDRITRSGSMDKVVCVDTIPPMHHKVMKLAFFVHTIKVKDPVAIILSKVIPCKCFTRMSHDVWESLFKAPSAIRVAKARNAKERDRLIQTQKSALSLESTLRNWILASLLGGYEHVTPDSRPLGVIRDLLYGIFSPIEENNPDRPCYLWFFAFTKVASPMINFAIRDFLLNAIEDLPALKRQLGSLFDVTQFRYIVIYAMDTVRRWFGALDPGVLRQSFYHARAIQNDESLTRGQRELKACHEITIFGTMRSMMKVAHEKMLGLVAYDGSETSIEHSLKTQRGDVPLRSLRVSRETIRKSEHTRDVLFDDEEEEEEEDDEANCAPGADPEDKEEARDAKYNEEQARLIEQDCDEYDSDEYIDDANEDSDDARREEANARVVNPIQTGYSQFIIDRFVRRDRIKAKAAQRKANGLDLTRYLSQQHIDALTKLCEAHVAYYTMNHWDYVTADTVMACVDSFTAFGIEQDIVDIIIKMCGHMRRREYSDKDTVLQLKSLKRNSPYAYSLLQCSVDITLNAQKIVVVANLPADYTNHQIHALSQRFKVTRAQTSLCVEDQSCFLYYCKGCYTIHSLVRDFKSPFKQRYASGWRDVYFSYELEDGMCGSRRPVHPGTGNFKCHEHPLCKIPMVGRVVRFSEKLFCLCPNCGALMRVDPANGEVTEKGLVCCLCTDRVRQSRVVTKTKLLESLGISNDTVSCFRCSKDKQLRNTESIFMYGYDLFLCSRHHSVYLARSLHTQQLTLRDREMTREEIVQFVISESRKRQERSTRISLRNNKGKSKPKNKRRGASATTQMTSTSASRTGFSHLKLYMNKRGKKKKAR